MAAQQSDWLKNRKKALRRIANVIDVEEREVATRGMDLKDLFAEAKRINAELISRIDSEMDKELNGG